MESPADLTDYTDYTDFSTDGMPAAWESPADFADFADRDMLSAYL